MNIKSAVAFRPGDDILEQLVGARREQVVQSQRTEAEHLKDIESRGQERLAALRKTLPRDTVAVLDNLDKGHAEATAASKRTVDRVTKELASSSPSPEGTTAAHPGLAGGQLVAPNSLGWFTPYYGVLHGSDGRVSWQGYDPGVINLGDWATGAGSGIFGTGAGSFTVYMDWWFTYVPNENRNYGQTIYVPYHGFYILYADDGFWDSKEAHARIDMSAVGYQYNYKSSSSTNVFNMQSQNINVNDRFDGWRTMYYSDLLGGGDRAYLRVTSSFYVYARGGGSTAKLNFSDGNANYVGIPWVHVN